MTRQTKKAVVVCPGRGTYNKSELGYLYRHHADKTELIQKLDRFRQESGQATITELDQASQYAPRVHTRGDNASSLIYACAYADFASISSQSYEVVAVTGNSMGWYIALACANALAPTNAMTLIDTMGRLMTRGQIGGQLIYPLVDENWQPIPGRIEELDALSHEINQQNGSELYDSIHLGGLRVFAGNDAALKALMASLPPVQAYPMRLPNHAAFHSALMQNTSDKALSLLPEDLFQKPTVSLVDGRGEVWQPYSCDLNNLWTYTLEQQVVETYNFTRAIQVCVQEFAPDCLIIPGPGNTLGGATAQALIDVNWRGIRSKQEFIESQKTDPFILSMGLEEQRELVID